MTANTIEEFEADVGEKIKSLRLKQNIDRATLALRAGCSVSALKNLEYGTGTTLRTLIVIVRALGREDWLRHVAPHGHHQPIEHAKGRQYPSACPLFRQQASPMTTRSTKASFRQVDVINVHLWSKYIGCCRCFEND